ncbi:MAG: ferritin-like domain-containing protein [Deltaproteobacteria bacterium]|nr:ferritin-like domain-containing protein [Deltaproteobacteria bacterium]
MTALVLDLQSAARPFLSELGELPSLADPTAAQRTWRARMVNEHVSARVFGALLGQAMAAGLSAQRQTQLADFACEELRHARQCAAVVQALGGAAVAELPNLPAVPQHAEVDPLQALLRNIVSVCCLSETVAVALIRAETLQIGPPGLRSLLDQILADEVGHAQFGWSLLRELAPLPAALEQGLTSYAKVAMDHVIEHELAHLPDHRGFGPAAAQVGVCSGRAARALLADTLATVVAPGLLSLGIDARTPRLSQLCEEFAVPAGVCVIHTAKASDLQWAKLA